jgi:hypothetical protein
MSGTDWPLSGSSEPSRTRRNAWAASSMPGARGAMIEIKCLRLASAQLLGIYRGRQKAS